MTNIIDYIEWRGDLTPSASPFNEVDCLVLSQLAYVEFAEVMKDEGITLAEAARELFMRYPRGIVPHGLMQPKLVNQLLAKAARSERFGSMTVLAAENKFDDDLSKEQFAAVTFTGADGKAYVCFRGTDHTIAGWQENFNMAVLDSIPAQLDAVAYIERIAERLDEPIIALGHSKGGNLAVYAAVFASLPCERIERVFNFDGPGFSEAVAANERFAPMLPKITSIVPQGSVVGMLLEHREKRFVIKSAEKGLLQHDGFSWIIRGAKFVELKFRNTESMLIDKTLSDWISGMNQKELETFASSLYELLSGTKAQTLDELPRDTLKLIKKLRDLDSETRDFLARALKVLREQALRSAKETALERIQGT